MVTSFVTIKTRALLEGAAPGAEESVRFGCNCGTSWLFSVDIAPWLPVPEASPSTQNTHTETLTSSWEAPRVAWGTPYARGTVFARLCDEPENCP